MGGSGQGVTMGGDNSKGGFIAVFTNDNGNCSVCAVVFASVIQAQDWAEEWLKADGARNIQRTETEVTGEMGGGFFGPGEVRFSVHPMAFADVAVSGRVIKVPDLHTIR